MRKVAVLAAPGFLSALLVLGFTAGPRAQDAKTMTLRGEIVEVSCFQKGVAEATGTSHLACAKECVQKGQALGVLTDGEGLIKITGDYAANKYAKLTSYIGQQVEVTGTSDRYLD